MFPKTDIIRYYIVGGGMNKWVHIPAGSQLVHPDNIGLSTSRYLELSRVGTSSVSFRVLQIKIVDIWMLIH